jgi:hypothetical protein
MKIQLEFSIKAYWFFLVIFVDEYSLKGTPPPFPEQKKFFFRFFDFYFQRCIKVHSIRAVKIRSLPSRIVREKANFRRGVPQKKKIFFQGKKYAHSMRDTIKPKIIHNKNSWKKKFFFNILSFSQNRFLSNRKKFSPFFSKTAGPIGLKFFLVILQLIWGVYFFFFVDISYQ